MSSSRPIRNGAEPGFDVPWRLRLVDDETDGLGDDESWRDGSTGGKGRFGLGDKWCTWEAISSSMFCPDKRLLRPNPPTDGLPVGVVKARIFGVLRKSGLVAHGSAVFQVTRGS